MKKKRTKRKATNPTGKTSPPFPKEFKLRVVRLYLEEGYQATLIAKEFKVSEYSVYRWSRLYRQYGERGLEPGIRKSVKGKQSKRVKKKIVAIRKENPSHGSRRISDILKRFFLIDASPSSVHKTLSDEGLVPRAKKKPKKNPSKPRFFERATPNQMWQSDIMTFRLGGRNAYLIGYLDDYSRYITGLGLYRSQTAEHVIETYRKGISEYGVPKEMLTDNGRQYTNWRGTTRFEKELKKDRVKHIRSRPHHPMTLGKIERFWQTIQQEFLQRAQFTSFDNAVERTAFWVKYYNYKRPHQGIGGLCPADRFFEIQHALKTTLEKGVEENALELALRGKPRDPFYMVGRMGDQSVVIRAEKGKIKMLVDGEDATHEKELVYDARKDINHEENQTQKIIRSPSKDNRRFVGMDRAAHDNPNVPGAVHQFESTEPVAEPGHGGDGYSLEPQTPQSAENVEPEAEQTDRKEFAGSDSKAAEASESHRECQSLLTSEDAYEKGITEKTSSERPQTRRDDHEGTLRPDDCFAGRRSAGRVPQDLLQMGAAWPCRPAGRSWRPESRPPQETGAGVFAGETTYPESGRDRAFEAENHAKRHCGRNRHDVRIEPDEKKMSRS
jgi:transposase InsO family protein